MQGPSASRHQNKCVTGIRTQTRQNALPSMLFANVLDDSRDTRRNAMSLCKRTDLRFLLFGK